MADIPSQSRIRILLAQFCHAQSIDVDALFGALGVDPTHIDKEALAHMAGVMDGMNVAAARIKEHGVEKWARDV